MKRVFAILFAAGLLLPAAVAAGDHCHSHRHHDRDVRISGHTVFDLEGDVMVITHEDKSAQEIVRITADGELSIDGRVVATDEGDRKLLRRFYGETKDLHERAEAISEDADEFAAEIADESLAYAKLEIAAALASLRDDDDADVDVDVDGLGEDFEAKVRLIEEIAEDLGERADLVVETAERLQERIPELADLDWFVQD